MRYFSRFMLLSMLPLTLMFVLAACDKDSSSPLYPEPRYARVEFSFGKITVINDMAFSTSSYDAVLVGYRDSLGDGDKQPIILITDGLGNTHEEYILNDGYTTSLDVITRNNKSFRQYAVGEGPATTAGIYRIHTAYPTVSYLPITVQGSTVHPTNIIGTENGSVTISGWIEDGGLTKAYIMEVDTIGLERWSRYIEMSETDVKGEDLVSFDGGYYFACSYVPNGPGNLNPYSRILTLTKEGGISNTVEVKKEGLLISEFDRYNQDGSTGFPIDSGYVVSGQRYLDNQQPGFIGLLNSDGTTIWEAPLEQVNSFVPRTITALTKSLSFDQYVVSGNSNNQMKEYYLYNDNDKTKLSDVTDASPVPVEFVQSSNNSSGSDMQSELANVQRDRLGVLKKATAIVRFWEK